MATGLVLLLLLPLCAAKYDGYWQLIIPEGATPSTQSWHQGAAMGNFLYLSGGDKPGNNHTFAYNVLTNQWIEKAPPPAALKAGDMAASGGLVWAFGGKTQAYVNDLAIFQPAGSNGKGSWRSVTVQQGSTKPPQRNAHTLTPLAGVMFVFGGWDENKYFNDLWAVDTTALAMGQTSVQWTQLIPDGQANMPGPRNGHTLEAYGGMFILFGGFRHNITAAGPWTSCTNAANCVYYNDVWTWTPPTDTLLPCSSGTCAQWTLLRPRVLSGSSSGPVGRYGHAASIIGESMYVFGGVGPTHQLEDLWQFTITTNTWRELTPTALRPTSYATPISGVLDGRMYMLGGGNKIWVYTPDTLASVSETCPTPQPAETCSLGGVKAALAIAILLVLIVLVLVGFVGRKLGLGVRSSAPGYSQMDSSSLTSQPLTDEEA